MEILLIDPVTTARSVPVAHRRRLRRGIGYPGLGLLTVAALTPPEHHVRVVDEAVEEVGDEDGLDLDLVGITVQAPAAARAYALADRFRARGVPVVLGGIHASLRPGEAAAHADAVVVGEAERSWPALLRDIRAHRLRPLYRAGTPAELDASPRPRRELLRATDYRIPYVVQASKGCPWGCEFCALHAYLGEPRHRSADAVAAEIAAIPAREILFADDNFHADPERARALMTALLPLRRRWVAEATWTIGFDPETLALAKRSGCAGLFVGFDSINEQRFVRKVPADAERLYVESMRNIRGAGIPVVAAFVFGLDNDDASVFGRSVAVARAGGASLVNFSSLVPYPGTPVHLRLEAEGRILHRDWSRYISPNVCFQPAHMSPEELRAGVIEAQRRFYSCATIARRAAADLLRFGWGGGLLSLALNVAQRRNWGQGSAPSGSRSPDPPVPAGVFPARSRAAASASAECGPPPAPGCATSRARVRVREGDSSTDAPEPPLPPSPPPAHTDAGEGRARSPGRAAARAGRDDGGAS